MTDPTWVQITFGGVSTLSALIGVYVGLTMRATAAELRKDMAEMEGRIVQRLNGTYRRSELCDEKHLDMDRRIEILEKRRRGRVE